MRRISTPYLEMTMKESHAFANIAAELSAQSEKTAEARSRLASMLPAGDPFLAEIDGDLNDIERRYMVAASAAMSGAMRRVSSKVDPEVSCRGIAGGGMNLRDWFAALVVIAVMTSADEDFRSGEREEAPGVDEYAIDAYRIADAMIVERIRERQDEGRG